MRYLQVPGILDRNLRVRHLALAEQDGIPVLGVLIGDAANTCSVHWLRQSDGHELARRAIPVFPYSPDPALSADLSLLAYAVETTPHQVVVEAPLSAQRQRGRATVQVMEGREGDPRDCTALGISRQGHRLRVSTSDGDLFTFAIPTTGTNEALHLVDWLMETIPPATVLIHGNDAHFNRCTNRPGPTDLFITAGEGTVGDLIADQSEPEVFDLGTGARPRAGAISGDGRWLALALENRVQLWAINGWRMGQAIRLEGHAGPVQAVAFTSDGKLLASADDQGNVILWDVDTRSVQNRGTLPIGPIGGLVFSLDDQHCIAGGERGRIAIWARDEAIHDPAPNFPPVVPGQPFPPEDSPESTPVPSTEPEPAEDADLPSMAWATVQHLTIPPHAVIAGHEADGTPLYAARAAHKGGVYLGKFRPGFGGANIGYRRREVAVQPFEILVGSAVWVTATGGEIPPEAIPCGQDDKGNPLYLARGLIGNGLHPGRIGQGMSAARIPYGGAEIDVSDYEVMVRDTLSEEPDAEADEATLDLNREPLLAWDFENTMSDRGISIAVGISSAPRLISGFVSQTGGGPAEVWGENGTVFLIRYLGTNDVYLWLTVTAPLILEAITFRHWHNHNVGFPSHPSYTVQVHLEEARGEVALGQPLTLSNETSGRVDSIWIGRVLQPGSYKLRWRPRGLSRGRDTNSEFFAMKGLRLDGRFLQD